MSASTPKDAATAQCEDERYLTHYRMTLIALHAAHGELTIAGLLDHMPSGLGEAHSPSQANTAVKQLAGKGYLTSGHTRPGPPGKKGSSPLFRSATPDGLAAVTQSLAHYRRLQTEIDRLISA